MYSQFILSVIGCFLILFSTFWFRTPIRDINDIVAFRKPMYDQIVLFFLDATGYRYIINESSEHEIFQTITILKDLSQNYPLHSFLKKTKAVPPSTDFTILSIINGIKQMQNNLDVTFKSNPAPYEDSILRKQFKSALYSSKKHDWLRMTSGEFTFVENPQFFNLDNIQIADLSSYQFFKQSFLQDQPDYQFYVVHMMGFDALGHALQHQDYDQGIQLFRMFNAILEGVVNSLKENQLLIVIGDHDQSKRGKHYQCSEESTECQGFIFAFSIDGLLQENQTYDFYEPSDISATITSLLGYSSTSQNLGKIIPQFYPRQTDKSEIQNDQERVKNQVLKYLQTQGFKISPTFIEELKQLAADQVVVEVQRNIQIGLPRKDTFFFGILLMLFSIYLMRNLLGLQESVIIVLTGFFNAQIMTIGLLVLVVLRRESNLKLILKILALLMFIQLNYMGYIPDILLSIEIQFLLLLAIKYQNYINSGQNFAKWKISFLFTLVMISQFVASVFFLLDQNNFELRKSLLQSLIIVIILFFVIDPRYFNKGRVKALYLSILFILSDVAVIFQLNYSKNFIQFILQFMLMQYIDVGQNVLISKILYNAINPIKIDHQVFKGYKQLNMNSMILLTKEFDIGPSLFSVFIGSFGCQIIGIASLFFNQLKLDRHKIVGAMIISSIFNLILDSWQILNYNQSILNTNQMIEEQIVLLNSLPMKLLELILYSFAFSIFARQTKKQREM
ncbi:unnamed protein product (macronuclear) [Paramecium tetraurelia]|uniref:GPI ethanolamine phosphate transferase 3 n=1 Tax=Paramecium tetraurelia TaxID=5888 RepID=A0CC85_PARTE|nr:uncharacterized protein GSPATT00037186001 [Paramecium tetraurelia]CAK68402.1 unnamed protein product [Paramecium tetraurelia]|eukprot:XP_001435799.1 hypothetical protein (macronuclear) [Paramecium tetraurelia strain d4-2]